MFVLVDVGCIECGEATEVVGVYATRDEAVAQVRRIAVKIDKEIPDDFDEWGLSYFTGGQRRLEIHEVGNRDRGEE